MQKLLMLSLSSLLGLSLAGAMPEPGPQDEPPPPPKRKKGEPAKKKDEIPGPAGDLHRAYDLLRRIKAEDGPTGRSDERLRDWTDRAAKLYRKGVEAHAAGDPRLAHEYGTAAHDLARAVDHTRNAAKSDRPDPDLPPPPDGPGPGGDANKDRRDLRHAYDRIREAEEGKVGPEAKYFLDAARDLYNAARRDIEGDRHERGGELARAAEALTHVPEHLEHIANPEAEPRPRPPGDRPDPKGEDDDEPKAKRKARGDRPDPKKEREKEEEDGPRRKRAERPDDAELPPPLPPR